MWFQMPIRDIVLISSSSSTGLSHLYGNRLKRTVPCISRPSCATIVMRDRRTLRGIVRSSIPSILILPEYSRNLSNVKIKVDLPLFYKVRKSKGSLVTKNNSYHPVLPDIPIFWPGVASIVILCKIRGESWFVWL